MGDEESESTYYDPSYFDSFNVCTDDLQTVISYLADLKANVGTIASENLSYIIEKTTGDGRQTGRTSLGTPFGGFTEAMECWTALQDASNNMVTSLTTLQTRLETLMTGTQAIIDAYEDVEARNNASAEEVEALLIPQTYETS